MTFIPSKPFISYKYIEAKTPSELEILMLSLSVKAQYVLNFTSPIYANGKWCTWYMYDWSQEIKPKDKFEMENN